MAVPGNKPIYKKNFSLSFLPLWVSSPFGSQVEQFESQSPNNRCSSQNEICQVSSPESDLTPHLLPQTPKKKKVCGAIKANVSKYKMKL